MSKPRFDALDSVSTVADRDCWHEVDSLDSELARGSAKRMPAACWVSAAETARVAGIDIGGMVFVGEFEEVERYPESDAFLIDPTLPVASGAPSDTAAFYDYDSSYQQLSPSERRVFLHWLASGRSDPHVPAPCVRLYFFGLEYRLLVGSAGRQERVALLAEVRRLLAIYGEDPDLCEELGTVLRLAPILDPEACVPNPKLLLDRRLPELPLALRVGLGRKLVKGDVIGGDWLLSWWLASPATKVRPACRKCFEEFSALFALRLASEYPTGYRVRSPSRRLRWTHHSASGKFSRSFDFELEDCADVSKLMRPVKLADRIAEQCASELEPYCRLVQRSPQAKDTVQAFLLLPEDLAARRENSGLRKLHAWAETCLRARRGAALIDDLLELCEGERPKNVQPRRVEQAVQALRTAGIGLAPHPSICDQTLRVGDPIALYRLADSADGRERVSGQYRPLLTALRCAVYVAQANGHLSDAERRVLETCIADSPLLQADDRVLLRTDLVWLAAKKQSLLAIKKRCADYPATFLRDVRRLAAAVVSANGLADPVQVQAVQKLYRTMGVPEDDALTGLHRASGAAPTQPIPVFEPESSPLAHGIGGPREASSDAGRPVLDLDAERISEIVADTRKVSEVLSDVFVDEASNAADHSSASGEPIAAEVEFEGLDATHCALVVALQEKPSWTEVDFASLARRCSLMPGGALEAVNEWSFERFGEPLLEEDEELVVNQELVKALRNESAAVANATA